MRSEHLADSQRIRSLDGLRAIAILLVMLHHMTPNHDSNKGLSSLLFKVADIGWSGVDLFFVLSGFLITGILLRAKDFGKPLATFFVRRIRRIVPAYVLALVVVFFVVPFYFQWYDVPPAARQLPYWLYASNYFRASWEPLNDLFGMSHFWSLAVEMQFYLAWPFLVRYFSLAALQRAIFVGLIIALVARFVLTIVDANWTTTFAYLPCRMDGLLAGALVATWVHTGFIDRAGLRKFAVGTFLAGLLILAICVWQDLAISIFRGRDTKIDVTLRTLYPTLFAMTYGSALVLALTWSPFAAPLRARGMGVLAKYSYGAYIIHYLLLPLFILWFGPATLGDKFGISGDATIYLFFVIASIVTYAAAAVSFHTVEQRFMTMNR